MRLTPLRSLFVATIAAASALALALPAAAQGPPDIRWRGTHGNFVQAVAISPDGTLVASGSADRTTKIWRVSDGALVRTIVQCAGVSSPPAGTPTRTSPTASPTPPAPSASGA